MTTRMLIILLAMTLCLSGACIKKPGRTSETSGTKPAAVTQPEKPAVPETPAAAPETRPAAAADTGTGTPAIQTPPAKPVDYLSKTVVPSVANPPTDKYPLRWIYCSYNFQVNEAIDKLIEICKEARTIGYNGVLITDYKFGCMKDRPKHYYANLERFAAACKEIDMEIIPTALGNLLINDPMMAEGMPVKEQEFLVTGTAANVKNTANLVTNGGFENMKPNRPAEFADFDWVDGPGVSAFRDEEVRHSGTASIRMENFPANDSHGNARINKKLTLKPWHHYKASVWIRTEELSPCNGENPKIIVLCEGGRNLIHRSLNVKPTQDWTQHTVTFNSLEFSAGTVYCGLWGGKSGKIWVDDMEVSECGAVNMIRRDGCPMQVTNEDGTVVYEEGRDFDEWKDPKSGYSPWPGSWDDFHEAPPIVLTAGSRIKGGDTLKVSYYQTVQVLWGAVFPCWLNENLFTYAREQLEYFEQYFHPKKIFLSHDEIRLAGWCGTCSAYGTNGRIMAEHIRRYIALIREVNPDAEIFVWNDMFDPYHNAFDWVNTDSPWYRKENPYYLAATPFAGAWEGLDKSVIIANWYSGVREKNIPFYDNLGMREIIAGYYDSDRGQVKANLDAWLDTADQNKGVVGVMYTTWGNNYKNMDIFYQSLIEHIRK